MEEVMVERTAGGAADLLMECDEEELEVYPQSPERDEDEEEEEEGDQLLSGLEADDETDPPPVRIVPIPVQPVSSCSLKHSSTLQCSGPLGFRLNGRPVSLLPGGAGVQLKLRSHPEGSSSGFTSVQIPVTLTVHSPAGTQHINTTASLTTAAAPAAIIPKTEPEPNPIITGVVSGEAAQRVLSNHSVNFKFSPPVTGLKTPPSTSTVTLTSPPTTASAPRGSSKRRAPPPKLLHKGQVGPVSPPDCLVCRSQYKLIMELRGFMCLCSPEIAQSLKSLKKKKKKKHRRSKTSKSPKEPQSASKVSKSRPPAPKVTSPIQRTHRPSDDFVPVRFTSPVPPPVTASSPPVQNQSEPPSDPLRGKLVIMVEDFYYGSARGRSSITDSRTDRKPTGPYRCIHCPHTLRNNIKLMSHMNQHVSTMSDEDGLTDSSSCPHCFRPFSSPFKLQCHLEAVHSQYKSTAKCRICELDFGSEPAFLWHMKSAHKPGEMPYVCQVCDFRSSFYSDLWTHFEQLHADTKHLLCQYCLRVLRSNTCYQQHFARHQKKNVFSCDKCRLHFLYIRERTEHNLLHHRTHVRPPQLTGLKPGTKVTVRTYSVVQGSESEEVPKKRAALKVVDVDLPPPKQEAPRRKPVERLGPLLSNLNQQSEDTGVSRPSQHCLECLAWFQDFRNHFPSLVHCSLCKFVTCCATSYANHMINNHATCRRKPQYHSIFLSEPRLSHKLECVSCTLTTCKGDVMANHLTEKPDHHCIMLTHNESGMNDEKTNTQPADISSSVTSPSSQRGGVFIPIHLLPSGQTSSQLSVKALTSPSPLSSPPAMTIKFLGPRPQPDQCFRSPLWASQLSAVLSYLCHGVVQATCSVQPSALTVHSWIRQQEHHLLHRKWCWRTEKLAEWVMSQREQQLSVSEDVLLQTARKALGENGPLTDCYSWAVDFLLRHELAVQPSLNHRGKLPRSIRDNSRVFIQLLSAQIQGKKVPPNFVASMDEFSIFIDQDQFSDQNPSALRLFGSPEEKPVFDVVLSALSDGTLLPPLLFYRGTPSRLPEGFPSNVLLEARQEEFTDQDCHKIWINKVWKPHVESHWQSVLIVDIHRGHLTNKFRTSLTSLSTDVFFIPSGCCCRLQPLDVCVTPVLRDFLQARWTQLVSQGGLDGLGPDQLALTLACWLSEVSSTLNSETNVLRRSFASACNLQEVEDRGEVVRIIQALTEALVQPLETLEPEPDPEPELELLLVMEEEKQQQEKKQQEKQQEEEQQQEEQEEEQQEEQQQQEQQEESLVKSPKALHQVFDGDSDAGLLVSRTSD